MNVLIKKMKALETQMIDVANDMEYYAGFNDEIRFRAWELMGAAKILSGWIEAIKNEI